MSALHNLSTRAKLVVVLIVMMLFLAIVTVVGLYALQTVSRAKDVVTDLTMVTNDVNLERMAVMTRMIVSTDEDRTTWGNVITQAQKDSGITMGRLGNYFGNRTEAKTFDQLNRTLSDYNDARSGVLVSIDTHRLEEAKSTIFNVQMPRYNTIEKYITALQDAAGKEAAYQIWMSRNIFLGCLGLALLAAAVMVWWLERVIATPLR
ncbi:MAG: MCP four helix bundle domain-containing protein, partial [Armatimonadota bacterium]|nr:MCP four helix bundle domain-containing protein [Armatimonadota bacterium]